MAFPYYCQRRIRPRRISALARLEDLIKKYGKLMQEDPTSEVFPLKLEKVKTAAANTLRNLGGSRT